MKRIIAGLTLLMALSGSVQAATPYFWDLNGLTPGAGGLAGSPNGTWSSASFTWSTSSLGDTAGVTFPSGNTAVFSAGSDAVGSYNVTMSGNQSVDSMIVEDGSPTISGTSTLSFTGQGNIDVAGASQLNIATIVGGTSALNKIGPGILRLSGANTFTNSLTVSGGILEATSPSAFGSSSSTLTLNAGTVRFASTGTTFMNKGRSMIIAPAGGTIIMTNTTTTPVYAGAISGTGPLKLMGPGTLVLGASNTWSGGMTVDSGTLKVTNITGSATGSGLVYVNAGATLAGNGHISGDVTLYGKIKPGASPGTIETGNETWFGGGGYDWEINNATGTPGADPGWDLITVNGSLTLNATPANKFAINITSLTAANISGSTTNFTNTSDYTWRIVATTTGITGFDPASINVFTSSFLNAMGTGHFVVELANNGKDMVVKFVHPPTVTIQPGYTNVVEGADATFFVYANGAAPFSYQWMKNGTSIAGATDSMFMLRDVTFTDNGYYSAAVSDRYGSVTSTASGLNVTAAPCSPLAGGIISWWPANVIAAGGSANDSVGQRNGTEYGVQYATGKVGTGFQFNGSNYVRVANSPAFNVQSVTVEAWVQGSPPASTECLFSKSLDSDKSSYAFTTGVDGGLQFAVGLIDGTSAASPDFGSGMWDGKFHHIVGEYDGAYIRLFVDGAEVGTGTAVSTKIKYDTNYMGGDVFIGSYDSGTQFFTGIVDELAIYGRTLSPAEIQSIYAARTTGKCNVPFCTPAGSGLVHLWRADGNATDSVGGSDGTFNNPTFVAGEVGQAFSFDGYSSYVTANVDAPTNAYTIEAWVKFDGDFSRGNYNTIVEFGNDSPYLGVTSDGTLTMYQTVSGGRLLKGEWAHVGYSWDGAISRLYLNGQEIGVNATAPPTGGVGMGIGNHSGDTTWLGEIDEVALYNRALGGAEIQATFNAGIRGICQTSPNLTIVSQPQSQTNSVGATAMFSVAVNGIPPVSYQWRKNGVNFVDDSRYVGSTSPTLTISPLQESDSATYSVLVSNSTSFVTSIPASLYVVSPPIIDMQPQSTTNPPGSTVRFSVMAHGTPPLLYKWMKNGYPVSLLDVPNISGGNSDILTISGVSSNDAGIYTVQIDNDQGSTSSSNATLTVFSIAGENYDNLISVWHADGDATDSFGSNHGTLQGTATFGGGKINQGFQLDGTNGYVLIPDSATIRPNTMTIEAWVKFDSLTSSTPAANPQYIVFKKNSRFSEFEAYALTKSKGTNGDFFNFVVSSSSGTQVIAQSGTAVLPGVFYHLVGTYNGTSISLYVNGASESTKPAPYPLDYGPGPLYFGTTGESYDGKVNCVIDEVRLYGRALSPTEVRAHYSQGNLGFVGLKLVSTNYIHRTSNDRALGLQVAGTNLYLSGSSGASGGDAALARYNLPLQSTNVAAFATNWPGASGADRFSSVAVAFDGAYFGGDSYSRTADSFGSKENKGMVVKFPLGGPVSTNSGYGGSVWDKQVPTAPGAFSYSGKETINAVASTTDFFNDKLTAVIYATGSSQRGSGNLGRMFLSRMRGDGVITWTTNDLQNATVANDNFSEGKAITLLNGYVYVAGRSDDGGAPKAMISKYSSAGAPQWATGLSSGYFNAITSFGGVLYAAGASSTNSSFADFLIEKRDESGNLLWSQTYDRAGSEDVLTGITAIGSRVYAVGWTRGNTAGGTDAVILEVDTATGSLISTTLFGGADDDAANAAATDGADLYVAGESRSYGGGGTNMMLLRYQISQPAVALQISTTTLPVGVASNTYTARFQAAGGVPPYVWTSPSTLPEGLAFFNGTLSGIPVSATTTNIVIQVSDSGTPVSSVSNTFMLTILGSKTPPTVAISSPINGAAYEAPVTLNFTVNASDADGLSLIEFYQDGILVNSTRGTPSPVTSFSLSGLSPASYNFYAVAYDFYQTPATSSVTHLTINGAGHTVIDFEPFDIATGSAGVVEPSISDYLLPYGISISGVTSNSALVINRDQNFGGGGVVSASSGHNIFSQVGKNGAVSYTLNFTNPAASFGFTRVKLLGSAAGLTHPGWRATAYSGTNILGSVNESAITTYSGVPQQSYTLYGPNITSVTIEADNRNYANFTSALLDDFVVVTNGTTLNNQPPTASIATPANGAHFSALTPVTVAVSGSDADGSVVGIRLYLGRSLLTTISGSSGAYTLNGLSAIASGYQLRAEAVDNQGAVKSSEIITFYVDAGAGVNIINFDDSLDATTKNIGSTNLAAYLAGYGVTVTNITIGSRVEIANVKNINGGSTVVGTSPENVLAHFSRGGAVSYTLNFANPVQSFKFSRPKLLASASGVSFPQWRARAFNSAGYELTSVGESFFFSLSDVAAQQFELAGSGITSVRFDSGGTTTSATLSGVVIDDIILNTNALARPLTVTLTSDQTNYASSPATVVVTASPVGNNPIDHVDFYAGPVLIGSVTAAPYVVTWTNVYPGSYDLRAIAVDNQFVRVASDAVHVTVNGSTTINNATFINFDSLDATRGPVSGVDLDSYLETFNVSVDAMEGSTVAAFNQQAFTTAAAYGSGVVAVSSPNVFTQTGSFDKMDFTFRFREALSTFQFSRVKLIAGVNGVTHPAWTAYAYDANGNVVATASEGLTTSYVDVAAQSYTLSGKGIVSVRFESMNRSAATFNAVLIDDLILTRSGENIAAAVTLTSPVSGESFYAPATLSLKAVATDPDGTAAPQVSFYANGQLIGPGQLNAAGAYVLNNTNVPLGRYVLTAVATDDSGATNVSAPVTVSVIPSPFTFAIWRQPLSTAVARGDTARFAVQATGTNSIKYQWQFNGTNIARATNSFLLVTNVDTAQVGPYRVIATSLGVSLTSDEAVLSIGDRPSITVQPVGQTATAGETVALNVTATGTAPLIYQWTLNGNPIPGATTDTYQIAGAQPYNSGYYQVMVGNSFGFAQSDKANVVVFMGSASPNSADNFADRVSINPVLGPAFGNNEQATKETNEPNHAGKRGGKSIWFTWHATFSGRMSFTTRGSSFDTLLAVYTGDSVTNLTLKAANDDVIDSYFTSQVGFNTVEGTDYQIAVDGLNGASGTVVLGVAPEGYQVLDASAGEEAPHITTQPQSQYVDVGGTATLQVTATGSEPLTYQWYLNQAPISGATASNLTIPAFDEESLGRYYVVVANDAGSEQSTVASLELSTVTDGVTASTSEDKLADITIIDDAVSRPSDGADSMAGTSRGYTSTQVFSTVGSSKESGEPNHCGVVGGASTWYGYRAPANGTLSVDTIGSTFDTILAVYTTPSGFLDFATLQSKGCSDVAGNGGEVVKFTAVSNTVYYIVVDGVAGASGTVHLNINLGNPPVITSAPQGKSVAFAGYNATLSVSASGSTNLYYRWKFNNGDIPFATNTTYTVTNVQTGINSGLYSVVISNLVNNVTSTPVVVEVASGPGISIQPADTNGVFGKSVTFRVTPTGTAPFHYQWQYNDVNIAGATGSTYTKTGLTFASAGNFRVVITNIVGLTTSSEAALTIIPAPPNIRLPLALTRFTNVNTLASFSGNVLSGMGVTNVQYQVNDGAFQDATLNGTNWSASVSLNRANTNVVGFKAITAVGESTVTNRSVYVYQLIPVSVVINSPGSGTIPPGTTGVTNGQRLEIGKTYTITAVPAVLSGQAYVFTNWSGDVSGTTNKVSFQMRSNIVIQANFMENPFAIAKGTYSGLFTNSTYDYKLSGFISVSALASQSFSGYLLLEGDKVVFSGKFNASGDAQVIVSRNLLGKASLTINLNIGFGTDLITGTISDGTTIASLVADHAVFSNTNVQTNFTGKYTFITPHDTNADINPGGYGFGIVAVSTNGSITSAGSTLGDGAAVAQGAVSVSKDGRWPFYSQLYLSKYITTKVLTPTVSVTNLGYRGSIMGWLQFTNNSAIGGSLKWVKTVLTNHLPTGYKPAGWTNYASGFTNEMEITGLAYHPVLLNRPILTNLVYPAIGVVRFTNAFVLFEDGNLTASITNNIFIHTNNTITLPSTNSIWSPFKTTLFTPTLTIANGSLSGSFYHPAMKRLVAFKGAVLQDQSRAYGFFQGFKTNGIGTNQTGAITILSVP